MPPTPVTDQAIEKIKQMIVAGELKPGDKLPKERDLALRVGVSRSSLREAVRALTLIRVLDTRQGDGTYVTSLEPHLLLDVMSFAIEFSHDRSVLQLLEVRRVLEPAATALAATRISEDELALARARLDDLKIDASVEKLVEADVDFHRVIVNASGNPILATLVERITSQTIRARRWRAVTDEGVFRRMQGEHEAIYNALKEHDAELARAAATIHIANVEAWLRHALLHERDTALDEHAGR